MSQSDKYTPVAFAARQADIVGKPQRVAPLKFEELSAETRAMIDHIRAAVGAGPATAENMPGYFLTMAKHPEVFRCQLEMGTAIFKGAIPPHERELAVLRVAWLTRSPYEWGEHVDIAKRYGVSDEHVRRVAAGSSALGWSEHEAAILRAVEELLADQKIGDETWDELANTWNEQQLIEFPMMVGQYVATAFVQNSLRIRLAEDNPGLSHR